MLVSPSSLSRDALLALFSDNGAGFNQTYASALNNHPGAPAMTIDFANSKSKTLFLGDVDPESVEQTGIFTYPLLTMFSIAGASNVGRNVQKFQRYSGLVKVGARFFLSGLIYKNATLMHDFEAWPDAVEDAVYQISQNPYAPWPSNSTYSVLYNGECAFERKFPVEGGSGWLQVLTFKWTFEVVIA